MASFVRLAPEQPYRNHTEDDSTFRNRYTPDTPLVVPGTLYPLRLESQERVNLHVVVRVRLPCHLPESAARYSVH
jgi:hypothetical protein